MAENDVITVPEKYTGDKSKQIETGSNLGDQGGVGYGQEQYAIIKVDIKNVGGFFDVISSVPAHKPRTMWDSIKIYINGATKRFYIYDFKNHNWMYTALT